MATEIIPDNVGNGFTLIMHSDNFEYVNPIEQTKKMYLEHIISLMRAVLINKKLKLPTSSIEELLNKRATLDWLERYTEIMETRYSVNFDKLLESNKKQVQTKLLKNQTISPFGFIAFIINAFQKYGYTYSLYRADHNPNGIDKSKLPSLFHVKENKVTVSGKSDLTDGQLKQIIQHRKVIISKFIDNGNKWHCFFTTYQSLKGEENWKDGIPHYHYISNAFGLTREQVLLELMSKDYKLNNLPHIELTDYKK